MSRSIPSAVGTTARGRTMFALAMATTAVAGAAADHRRSAAPPEALPRAAIATRIDRHGEIAAARIEGTDVWIVYLRTARGCGSGGCVPQLWRRDGGRFVRSGSVTVAKLPIVTLPGTAEGMPLLGITVYDKAGDKNAVQPLAFDGRDYRARPGDALLPEAAGVPLVTISMLRRF